VPELRAGGIDFPASVVSELELNGYAIERVNDPGLLDGAGKPFGRASYCEVPDRRVRCRASRPRPELQDHLNGA
jgi:hypothetical protein